MDERIVQFFRLEKIAKKQLPMINLLDQRAVDVVVTGRQAELFYDRREKTYYVRENVIGGTAAQAAVPGAPAKAVAPGLPSVDRHFGKFPSQPIVFI